MSVLSIINFPLALMALLLFATAYGVALCTYPHEPTLHSTAHYPSLLFIVSEAETATVGEALRILGYACMDFRGLNDSYDVSTYDFKVQSESSGEFTGLSWIGRHYMNIIQNHPDAKFIVPHSEKPEVERFLFVDSERRARVLLMANGDSEGRVGDKWVRLCEFLGLGYSVVERLHLRDFPRHGNRKFRVESVFVKLGRRLF